VDVTASREGAQARLTLRPFEPRHAELVSSWAPTAPEVWRWVSRRTVPVPPTAVLGWADEDDSLTYVAHLADEPVAFAQIWIEDGEDDAEVARVLVAPEHRGRGIGREVVLALAEVARRYKPQVALRVVPDNEPALRAYTAAGFARVTPQEETDFNEGQPVAFVWMRLRRPGAGPADVGGAARRDPSGT
jgi:ribosomal-protein-alanine N-acetyltransferase